MEMITKIVLGELWTQFIKCSWRISSLKTIVSILQNKIVPKRKREVIFFIFENKIYIFFVFFIVVH
jgi:hypothetical protein